MLRVVGIVALFVLAACDQTNAKVGPSPSPVIAQGSWTQNLRLTGELPGRITTIVADQGTQQTFCSGTKARNGETWASTFYTTVDSSGNEWLLSINVANFRSEERRVGKEGRCRGSRCGQRKKRSVGIE